jgi:hypothetical protein
MLYWFKLFWLLTRLQLFGGLLHASEAFSCVQVEVSGRELLRFWWSGGTGMFLLLATSLLLGYLKHFLSDLQRQTLTNNG